MVTKRKSGGKKSNSKIFYYFNKFAYYWGLLLLIMGFIGFFFSPTQVLDLREMSWFIVILMGGLLTTIKND